MGLLVASITMIYCTMLRGAVEFSSVTRYATVASDIKETGFVVMTTRNNWH